MSIVEGSYDDSGYVVWKTPEALYPSRDSTQINVGVCGGLLMESSATERGCIMETDNTTIQISIPYNTKEGHRKVRKTYLQYSSVVVV